MQALKEQVEELRTALRNEVQSYLGYRRARVDVLKAREESLLSSLSYTDSETGLLSLQGGASLLLRPGHRWR